MVTPRRLGLPENREAAWVSPGTRDVFVLMPAHERMVNLDGIRKLVQVPKLLMEFEGRGGLVILRHGPHQTYHLSNHSNSVCFGDNPRPRDPYEAWHFYWNGRMTQDLCHADGVTHQEGPAYEPINCPEPECLEHGPRSACPKIHRCAPGNCVCKPACICLKPPADHMHGYWADHVRRGAGRLYGKDERCHCCMGTCGHGATITCTCERATYRCPCSSNWCSCGRTCPRSSDVCGCGSRAAWLNHVETYRGLDYTGEAPAGAVPIANDITWLAFPGGRIVQLIDRFRNVVEEHGDYELALPPPPPPPPPKFKAGDVVTLGPMLEGDVWWRQGRMEYQLPALGAELVVSGTDAVVDPGNRRVNIVYIHGFGSWMSETSITLVTAFAPKFKVGDQVRIQTPTTWNAPTPSWWSYLEPSQGREAVIRSEGVWRRDAGQAVYSVSHPQNPIRTSPYPIAESWMELIGPAIIVSIETSVPAPPVEESF